MQRLHADTTVVVSQLKPVARLDSARHLRLAISLPLRNQQALTALLAQLSDPASPNYRKYLTPAQFAERFGPSEADYAAVAAFAQAHGLTVTARHPNRLILDVDGAVSDIEKTLHVTMRVYQHPGEARQFYAPDAEPSVDLAVPLMRISGLDNYEPPRPRLKIKSPEAASLQPAPSGRRECGGEWRLRSGRRLHWQGFSRGLRPRHSAEPAPGRPSRCWSLTATRLATSLITRD